MPLVMYCSVFLYNNSVDILQPALARHTDRLCTRTLLSDVLSVCTRYHQKGQVVVTTADGNAHVFTQSSCELTFLFSYD